MDLKQKYDQHKTTFNEQAWESFSNLRDISSSDKSKIKKLKKYNMKNTILLFCLLFGFASLALFFSLNYNEWDEIVSSNLNTNMKSEEKNPEKTLNDLKNADKKPSQKTMSNNIQKEEHQSKTDQLTFNQNKITAQTNDENESTVKRDFGKDLNLLVKDKKIDLNSIETTLNDTAFKPTKQAKNEKAGNTTYEASSHSIKTKQLTNNSSGVSKSKIPILSTSQLSLTNSLSYKNNFQLNKVDFSKLNSAKPSNQQMVLTPQKESKSTTTKTTDNISATQSNETTSQRNQLTKTEKNSAISKQFIHPLDIIFTELKNNSSELKALQAVSDSPIIYKNTFSIGLNIAPWSYVNGNIPYGSEFREVIKRGYFLDLDYRRRLNKILSIGIGFGYAHAKDVNNPELDTLDFETNIHAHARLFLFFLNNEKNRAFIKIGGGFMHSERLHSGVSALGPEEYERFMQWSNYNAFGITVEASYERNITQQLFGGINLGISTGNDGFSYTGLSIGYLLK